jgi:hypothetical protein
MARDTFSVAYFHATVDHKQQIDTLGLPAAEIVASEYMSHGNAKKGDVVCVYCNREVWNCFLHGAGRWHVTHFAGTKL